MLSREDDAFEGLEFEETFPAASAPDSAASEVSEAAPAPAAPPRLTVVRDEPAPEPIIDEPAAPEPQPALSADRFDELVKRIDDALTAALDQRIEQRLATFRSEIDRAFAARAEQPAAVPDRRHELVRDAIRAATSARDVARVLRDAVTGINETAVFALALHHVTQNEVVYRYRVAANEELGAALREGLDDGPDGAAAHGDGWLRGQRTVRVGTRNVTVHTVQCAIRSGDRTIGVLTLQCEKATLTDPVLARVAAMLMTAAPRLADLRDTNALRGA